MTDAAPADADLGYATGHATDAGHAVAPASGRAAARTATRQDRRRARTRAALLDAARRLMGAKGIDAVTIAEIAEEADVAFGSFYNHFESKDAIVEALVVELLDAVGEVIDGTIAEIDDPVVALATAFRMMHQASALDPSWGGFLVRASVADDRLLDGILARGRRDVERGVAAGRLSVPDLDTAMLMLAGAALFAARGRAEGRTGPDTEAATVEMMLRLVGVPPEEAAALAVAPMPTVVAALDLSDSGVLGASGPEIAGSSLHEAATTPNGGDDA